MTKERESKLLEFKSDTKKLRTHLVVCGASLIVLTIIVVLIGEKKIYEWFRGLVLAHTSFEIFLKFVSSFGNYVFYALFTAIGVTGLLRRKKRLFYYSLAYLAVQLLAAVIITRTLKIVVGRPRPDGSGLSYISTDSRNNSFPSGHTADMACSASVLSYFTPSVILRILLYLCLVLMGLSRMGLGSHYPFDLIGGAFLGLFTGYVISHFFSTRFLPRMLSGNRGSKKHE